MRGARCIRAQTDGGQLGGGAPRVVWLTLGADPKSVSAWSAAERLNHEARPPHLVWDPSSGDVAQLLPIVRAGCILGTRENIDYTPDAPPHRASRVNREGRLCVQIAVLGTPRDPFTAYHMLGLAEIMAWLDSWAIPRRWPAGTPAPFRQPARPRSRALWALGGHFGASQVPGCDSIGPGGIDIDQIAGTHVADELAEPARSGPVLAGRLARARRPAAQPGDGASLPLSPHRSPYTAAEPSLSAAGV
jgi:hypothetical protein